MLRACAIVARNARTRDEKKSATYSIPVYRNPIDLPYLHALNAHDHHALRHLFGDLVDLSEDVHFYRNLSNSYLHFNGRERVVLAVGDGDVEGVRADAQAGRRPHVTVLQTDRSGNSARDPRFYRTFRDFRSGPVTVPWRRP